MLGVLPPPFGQIPAKPSVIPRDKRLEWEAGTEPGAVWWAGGAGGCRSIKAVNPHGAIQLRQPRGPVQARREED